MNSLFSDQTGCPLAGGGARVKLQLKANRRILLRRTVSIEYRMSKEGFALLLERKVGFETDWVERHLKSWVSARPTDLIRPSLYHDLIFRGETQQTG